MVNEATLRSLTPLALAGIDIPDLGDKFQGKVRDIYRRTRAGRNELILITTDRLSAFDRVLGLVPYKGQVLNQLAAFWFERTADLIGNHLIAQPDPNVTVAHECAALPVEVIVRGYITGVTTTALWYRYSLGERDIYGYHFPDGLRKNQALPDPIITPTTKGSRSGHDERLTCAEVVANGLLDQPSWDTVQRAALAVFRRGQALAAQAGLILVDTKYEFGRMPGGEIVLIDEVHTPDSSRFWLAEGYNARLESGEEPENFDKEFIRLWYAARGYRGDGELPAWDSGLAVAASLRYQRLYELLTGRSFDPASYPAETRIRDAILRCDRDPRTQPGDVR